MSLGLFDTRHADSPIDLQSDLETGERVDNESRAKLDEQQEDECAGEEQHNEQDESMREHRRRMKKDEEGGKEGAETG